MSSVKKFFSACNKGLSQAETISIAIALLIATFMITINVIYRVFFDKAFSWSDELVRYLIIYVTLIGCSGCVRRKEHIAIDIVAAFIKNKKVLRVMAVAVSLICAVFSGIITVYGVQLVLKVIRFPQMTAGLRIPQYIPYLMVPIGFLLMTLRYTQEFVGHLIGVDFFAADHPSAQTEELEERSDR